MGVDVQGDIVEQVPTFCLFPAQELKVQLEENIGADPPLPVADAITLVSDRKKEWGLPDTELIKVPVYRQPPCLLPGLAHGHKAAPLHACLGPCWAPAQHRSPSTCGPGCARWQQVACVHAARVGLCSSGALSAVPVTHAGGVDGGDRGAADGRQERAADPGDGPAPGAEAYPGVARTNTLRMWRVPTSRLGLR